MDTPADAPDNNPLHNFLRKIYIFFASVKLALALLVTILVICLVGATFLSADKAVKFVFSTLWLNTLLVLLVVNIACCFSGRILGRAIRFIWTGNPVLTGQ